MAFLGLEMTRRGHHQFRSSKYRMRVISWCIQMIQFLLRIAHCCLVLLLSHSLLLLVINYSIHLSF